jgi:ATP adenylyltransferase
MSQSMIKYPALLRKVSTQYDKALKAKSLFYYPSKVTVLEQEVAGPSEQHGPARIPWTIRCVPALLDKAKEKQNSSKPSDSDSPRPKMQNPDDVFAPPYHPDLLVEELGEHTILLNKFCVVPKHFLLVTRGKSAPSSWKCIDLTVCPIRLPASNNAACSEYAGDSV